MADQCAVRHAGRAALGVALSLLLFGGCSHEPSADANDPTDRQIAAAAATMSPAPPGAAQQPAGAAVRNGIDVTGNPAGPSDRTGNDSRVNSWQDTPAKTGLGNAEAPAGVNGAGLGVGGNGRRAENDPGPANAAGSGVGTGKPGPAASPAASP